MTATLMRVGVWRKPVDSRSRSNWWPSPIYGGAVHVRSVADRCLVHRTPSVDRVATGCATREIRLTADVSPLVGRQHRPRRRVGAVVRRMAKLALARLDSNSLGVALRFSAWGNRLARRVGNWKRQRPFMSQTFTVVRADVRQVLATLAAYFGFDGVAVDAVVSEIDSMMILIGSARSRRCSTGAQSCLGLPTRSARSWVQPSSRKYSGPTPLEVTDVTVLSGLLALHLSRA
jgi:hypothetical protein